MTQLTEHDWAYGRMLKEQKVLEDIDPKKLDLTNGIILVACSDCDQFVDRYDFWMKLLKAEGGAQRIHPILDHGGALRIPSKSPLNKAGRSTAIDMIDSIEEAAGLKNIRTVILEAHSPCGKAIAHSLSLRTTIDLHMQAKTRMQNMGHNITYATMFHMHWPSEHPGSDQPPKKRYYRINKARLDLVRNALVHERALERSVSVSG